ncbi:UNVERIFIED_CONTAM: hypothetical protein FKN15_075136 [Acipenser sinensis]
MRGLASASLSAGSLSLLRLFGVPWSWGLAVSLGVYLGTGGWRYLRIVLAMLCSADGPASWGSQYCDFKCKDYYITPPVIISTRYVTSPAFAVFLRSGLYVLLRVKFCLYRHLRAGSTIPSIFSATAHRHPDKPALIQEGTGEVWSFSQLDKLSNGVAQLVLSLGLAPGAVVAVFMESRPLFVALWLGMAKVGVEAALINFNLRRDSLLHCVGVSGARAVIFGAELAEAMWEVRDSLSKDMLCLCTGDVSPDRLLQIGAKPLDPLLASASKLPPPVTHSKGFNGESSEISVNFHAGHEAQHTENGADRHCGEENTKK